MRRSPSVLLVLLALGAAAVAPSALAFSGRECPLGMQRGRLFSIRDDQLSGTPTLLGSTPADARLESSGGAGAFIVNTTFLPNAYLQVSFDEPTVITGYKIQPRAAPNDADRVTLIVFGYRNESDPVQGFVKLPSTSVTQNTFTDLGQTVTTTAVRFYPRGLSGQHMAMRVELFTSCVYGEDFTGIENIGLGGSLPLPPSAEWLINALPGCTKATGAYYKTRPALNGDPDDVSLQFAGYGPGCNAAFGFLAATSVGAKKWERLTLSMQIGSVGPGPAESSVYESSDFVRIELAAPPAGDPFRYEPPYNNAAERVREFTKFFTNMTVTIADIVCDSFTFDIIAASNNLDEIYWIDNILVTGTPLNCSGVGVRDTGNGACEACDIGTNYQDEPGQTTCKPVTESCAAGTFEENVATRSSDRQCTPCGADSYQPTSGQTSCETATICIDGTTETVALTPTSDRTCTPCSGGEYDHDGDASTPCIQCPPGTSQSSGGATSCDPCESGTYQDLPGQTSCKTASSECISGEEYILATANATSDITCSPCSACPSEEHFRIPSTCNGKFDAICVRCITCKENEFETQVCSEQSARTCGTCTAPCKTCEGATDFCTSCNFQTDTFFLKDDDCIKPCPVGEFGNTTSGLCQTLTVCQLGQTQTAAPTSTSDRQCEDCAAGTFDDGDPLTPCQPCPAGTTDHDSSPATACLACGPGNYTAQQSSGPCTPCSAGSADEDSDASTECVACGVGRFVPEGTALACSAASLECAIGTLDSDSDPATACSSCDRGTFVPAGSAGKCREFACPAGTIDNDELPSTTCVACPAGTHAPAQSFGTCQPCGVGTTDHDRNSATSCITCPAEGYFVPLGSSGACAELICPAGTADLDSNVGTACAVCNAGVSKVFQNTTGQTACLPCSTCGSDEWFPRVCNNTHDAICATCTTCNTAIVSNCTLTADTVCAAAAGSGGGGGGGGLVIIAAVAAIVVLLVVVVVVIVVRRRRSKRSQSHVNGDGGGARSGKSVVPGPRGLVQASNPSMGMSANAATGKSNAIPVVVAGAPFLYSSVNDDDDDDNGGDEEAFGMAAKSVRKGKGNGYSQPGSVGAAVSGSTDGSEYATAEDSIKAKANKANGDAPLPGEIVYESNDYALPQSSPEKGPGAAEYAAPNREHKKTLRRGADGQGAVADDADGLYAQLPSEQQGPGRADAGEVYYSALPGSSSNQAVYGNEGAELQSMYAPIDKKRKPTQRRHDDGVLYADLDMGNNLTVETNVDEPNSEYQTIGEDGEDDAVAVIHGEKPDTDYAKIDFVQSSAMELPEAVATSEAMPPILGPDGQPLPHMTRLEVEGILKRAAESGTYLIRSSNRVAGLVIFSVLMDTGDVEHLQFNRAADPDGGSFSNADGMAFADIPAIIAHYSAAPQADLPVVLGERLQPNSRRTEADE